MKKLTSVVLSVLMVISLFGCLFTGTTVSATETVPTANNLIANGDFEKFDVNTCKPNDNENHNCVPGFAWRSIKTILGNDKTNGQWYRTTDGCKPNKSPDLDSDYNDVTKSTTTYPTYFGANSQMVIEPTEAGNSTNHVLRAVQDLNAQVELENKGKYTLSFRFKLPNANTGLTSFTLSFITPDVDPDNPSAAFHKVKKPYVITNAKLESSGTDDGITIDSNNNIIQFAGSNAHEDWKNVKVTFEVNRDNTVDFPVYTDSADNNKEYTFPVLMRIQFSLGEYTDLSEPLGEGSNIAIKNKYCRKCIYFDDFVMNEVVDCVGDAEFYDVKGAPLPNEQAYTNITTTVGGKPVNTIYPGDKVTATVANYDKESGAYTFLGWYDTDGNKVTEGLSNNGMSVTFTAADGKTYTPRFSSTNLLGSSGSFEKLETGTYLRVDAPTATEPNFPTGNKWGFNVNAGYFGKTWKETIYDKDGISYQQTSDGSIKTDRLVTTQCNVLDNASIAKSGSKFLRFDEAVPVSLGLDNLEKHTDYVLSFYLRYSDANTANTNKINNIGITTTVNISDKTLDTVGMKTSLENAIPNHKIVVAKCDTTELNKVTKDKWQKMTINFNSGNLEKLYLVIRSEWGKSLDYYIDDMSLVAMPKVDVKFVDTKGKDITNDCANEAKPTITNSAKPGYLVANANYEDGAYDFRGWYDGDTLVSADKSFEFANGKYQSLTAKVVSRNILNSSASFENLSGSLKVAGDNINGFAFPSGNLWGGNSNDGYFKAVSSTQPVYDKDGNKYSHPSDAGAWSNFGKYTIDSTISHTGKNSLKINTSLGIASMAIEKLEKNTDYTLSYYWKADGTDTQQNLGGSAIVTTLNIGTASKSPDSLLTNTLDSVVNNPNHAFNLAVAKADEISKPTNKGDWKKVTLSFNSGNLPTVYLSISGTSHSGSIIVYLDDLTCYADNLTAEELGITGKDSDGKQIGELKYIGASIRADAGEGKPQALRHKFQISNDLRDNGNSVYGELVEYGSIAVPNSYLEGTELVKNGTYKGKEPAIGTAYNKDNDIDRIFAKDDTTITFTAALIGIGKTNSGTTNYDKFADKYTVRNYLIFKDANGKLTTVYTETQSYSVFDVMKAIEDTYDEQSSKGSVDKQVQIDHNTIQSIFTNNEDQKNAYKAWLEKQQ